MGHRAGGRPAGRLLGQSVPPPGLVRLGSVDSGLDDLASAGNRFTVRIDRA
ncbi:hypothetical protein [Nonomuraea sp. NPDC049709]|uniref:hypothetical protein n=1 Tax=Nonomuraea sp. NPDC049709 TaxID=3154736 RepID=UPI00342210A4